MLSEGLEFGRAWRTPILAILATLIMSIGVVGCGSDGNDGQDGPPGQDAGVDINNATEIKATIDRVTIQSPPVVEFTLTDGNGNGVDGLPASSISFNLAKLIEGDDDPVTGNGNQSAWQSYVNRVEEAGTPGPDDVPWTGTEDQIQATTENGSAGDLEGLGGGKYRYTFAVDVTNVTSPLAVPYEPNLTHRVSFEIRGFVPVANPVYDWRPSDGATTGLYTRTMIKTDRCNVCHEQLQLHGGARAEVKECVACHNPGSTDAQSTNTVDMKVMIHKIHRGRDLTMLPYEIWGFRNSYHNYSEVGFPQDIRNCRNCHNETDAETPDAKNWFEVPTAESCGACHDDVNFETGDNHIARGVTNNECLDCHSPTASRGAIEAHRLLTAEAKANYSINILNIAYGGGDVPPTVDFSVTDPRTADPSDPDDLGDPYDLANDPALTQSNLRFTLAWPTEDYTNEGRSSSTNPPRTSIYDTGVLQATEISTGVYQLALDPTGSWPIGTEGSGGVTLEGRVPLLDTDGNDVGRIPVTTAVDYFAITDSETEPRREKVDIARCNNCHEILSFHGANRNDNVGSCVTCHNPPAYGSGATPGDLLSSVDFKVLAHRLHLEATYPQRISNCTACHTDDGFYPVSAESGVLPTSIDPGADPTTRVDDTFVTPNSAVCSVCHDSTDARAHMVSEGGSFAACLESVSGELKVDADPATPGCQADASDDTVVETCVVCHGEGRGEQSVATVHGLN